MNVRCLGRFAAASLAIALYGLLFGALPAVLHAAPQLFWDPGATGSGTAGGSGTWDTGSWWNGASDVGWVTGDNAVFGGTAGTATILNGVSANDLAFNTAGYVVTGSSLTLTGGTVNAYANATISSLVAGTAGLTVVGPGTLTLNGSVANSFTGNVNVNSGGLLLDFTNMSSPANLINSNAVNLSSGSLTIKGNASGTTSQTFNGLAVGTGNNYLNFNSNGGTLNVALGSVTRNGTQGGLDVTLPSSSSGTVTATVPAVNNYVAVDNGSYRDFMTVNGGQDWAAISNSTTTGNIVPLSSIAGAYTLNALSSYSTHTEITTNDTFNTSGQQTGDLYFNTSGATVTIGSTLKSLGVNAGGILVTPGVTAGITGGTLYCNGSGDQLQIFDYGKMTINSVITNNGGTAVPLIISGTGNTTISSTANYTGTTTVNSGTLTLNAASGGSGFDVNSAIVVQPNGTLALNVSDTLGYNSTASATISGVLVKTDAQSETLGRPITLSGGTMTSTTTSSPNGAWNFYGNTISTAASTANYITGAGGFTLRSGAGFSLGQNSTLSISVPVTQYNGAYASALNQSGSGTLVLSSNSNLLTGNISLSGGTLAIAGATTVSSTSTTPVAVLASSGAYVTVSSGAAFISNGIVKLGEASGSAGNMFQSGGTVAITGADSSGNDFRALTIGDYPNETSSYTLTAGSLSVPNGPTFAPWNGTANLSISGGSASLKGIVIGATAAAGDAGAGNITLSGGQLMIGSLGITNSGGAYVTSNINLSGGTLGAYASWSSTQPMTLANTTSINPQGNTMTLSGALTGGGGLIVSGGGLLVLGGSNASSYSGGTYLSTGTLQLGSATGIGSGALTVNGGGTFDLYGNSPSIGGVTLVNGNIISSVGTPTLTGTSYTAQSGSISVSLGGASSALNVTGPGLVTLSGGNTFGATLASMGSTTVTISGGTLAVTSDANLGAAPLSPTPNSLVIGSSATLQLSSGFTINANRGIGLGDSAATIGVLSGTANYAGVLAAGPGASFGSLTKAGAGVLVLGGSNTYMGTTNVNAGGLYVNGSLCSTAAVNVAGAAALGGSGSVGAVTINSGGTIDVSTNGSNTFTSSSLTFNGNAAVNLPTFTSTSSLALQTGSVNPNGGFGSVQFYFPQTSIANGTYRLLAYSGSIGGIGFSAFSVVQPPALGYRQQPTLENNNGEIDYLVQGQTPYWNGQQADWQSSNAWTLQPSGSLATFHAGDNDVFDDTAGSGAFGTAVTINQGNVIPISATFNNVTSAYSISGSNGVAGPAFVQINGAGSLTIYNSNGYSGGTQFNAGTLNIDNPSAIGSGLLTIGGTSGGTLGNTSGGLVTLATNNTQAWNADFTFNGPNDLNLGTGAVTLSGSRTVTLAAGNLTVGGPIGGVGASLTVAGTGGLILGGANTYNSGTFILGGNITAANNTALSTGPVAMNPASGTATLNLITAAPIVNSLSSGGAGTSIIVLGNTASSSATTLTVNTSTATTFSGTIGDLSASPGSMGSTGAAVGSLVVAGNGLLNLAGTNTYTGSTTVSSGTLQLGSATALYAGASIGNAAVNGTLDLAGNNASVGGLSGSGTIATSVGSANLTVGNNNATSTFAGALQGTALSFTKTGSGTFVLTGPNNAGSTLIGQGTLQMNAAPTNPTSGSVAIAAGATFQENCTYYPLALTGSGTWNVNANNGEPAAVSVNFNGANSNILGFTGTTNVPSGNRYRLGSQLNVPSGPIVVASGGQFGIGYSGLTTANLFIAGSSWVGTGGDNNGALRLDGADNSGGNFAGTLTLDANAGVAVNAATGGTGTISANVSGPYQLNIVNGTITLSGSNSFGSLSIAAGAGAIAGNFDTTAFGNGGALLSNGTAQLNGNSLSVANLSGAGSVQNGNSALPATLTVGTDNTSTAFTGVISNGGAAALVLTKTGNGILTLGAENTFTGGTIISSGTLALNYGGTGLGCIEGTATIQPGATLYIQAHDVFGYSNAAQTLTTLNIDYGTLYQGFADNETATDLAINMTGGTIAAVTGGYIQFFSNGYGNTNVSVLPSTTTALISSQVDLRETPNATFTVTGGSTSSGIDLLVSGAITQTTTGSGFTLAGGGVMALTGSNTYTGTTAIDGGTLMLGTGGTSGNLGSGPVTDNTMLVFNRSDNGLTVPNTISGGGAVAQIGSGMTNISGGNSYSGGTQIQNGTLQIGNTAALGTGALAADGGTLDLNGFGITVPSFSGAAGIATDTTSTGATAFTVNQTASTTFGGSFQMGPNGGLVGLYQQGSGTLTVTGNSNLSSVNLQGASTLVISGTVSAGAVNINYMSPGGAQLAGSGSIVLGDTGLDYASTAASTYAGNISGPDAGGLEVDSGTLTLSGSNTYGGGTLVDDSGTLILSSAEAIPAGSSLTVGDAMAFGGVMPAEASSQPLAAPAITTVPEPGTLLLLAAGGVILALRRRAARR